AYTFKTLSDDQRHAIYEALKGQPSASAANVDVGTELPPSVELRPVPDQLAAQVPETKGYRYAVTQDRVLLVGTGRVVAGVLGDGLGAQRHGRRGRHSGVGGLRLPGESAVCTCRAQPVAKGAAAAVRWRPSPPTLTSPTLI